MLGTGSGNSFVCDNSTLANFQSWAGALFTAIESLGWVQTSDTGQAANPPAAVPSSTFVYRIYKANDSLASSMPITMKVMVGFSTTSPRIQFVVGTGSDGAGNVTGPGGATQTWIITQEDINHGSSTYPCYFSGHAGEFRMYMWRNAALNGGPSVIFGIERSKSATGADTGTYVTVFAGCANSNMPTTPYGGGETGQQSFSATYMFRPQGGISLHPAMAATMSDSGVVGSLPVFPIVGTLGNPMLGLQGAAYNDAIDGAIVTVSSIYGSTHSYVVASNQYFSQIAQGQFNNKAVLLLRYE